MMQTLIQPRSRTLRIEEEVERIRAKYNPQSVYDLEEIAKQEYGVLNVRKTFALTSKVTRTEEGLSISYTYSFKPYEPLVLSHEIGHIVAGHFNGRTPPGFFTGEFEADYFSQLLNKVSAGKFYAYLIIDSVLIIKQLAMKLYDHLRQLHH